MMVNALILFGLLFGGLWLGTREVGSSLLLAGFLTIGGVLVLLGAPNSLDYR